MPNFRKGVRPDPGPFEAALLPESEKERLCRSLLSEFGATRVRPGKDGELIHSCVLPFGLHKNGDSSPSASLNYKKLTYNCLGCQNSGGLLWFIATCRGERSSQSRKWLNQQTGLGGEEQSLSSLMAYFDEVYKQRPNAVPPIPRMSERVLEPWMVIHPYLTEVRGIPEETVVAFKAGYGDVEVKLNDGTKVKSKRIVIPHYWKGDLVGWQSRRLLDDGTPRYVSSPDFPKDVTIYNHDPRNRPDVVVVESALSVLSKTHLMPIVATFGASVTDRQVRLLALHRRLFLWFDNDEAGWNATASVAERASPYTQVFAIQSPYAADAGDVDDATAFSLVEQAVPIHLWERPSDLIPWNTEEE
jgi:hypothetical protein